jgi:phospholipid/cholesterol/gamma-HCH transport system substrate-binding protein
MMRVVRQNAPVVGILLAVMAVATAVTVYVLVHQRLRIPFQDVYGVKAEFSTTAGLTPGLGQPVNVAGVKVGTISGVELRNGRALVDMQIRPGKLRHVYENAHATMVPNTPTKDLVLELAPGGRPARVLREGGIIPIARTAPQIEADEFTNAFDTDTRQYFQALIGGLGRGTEGRARDFRALLRNLGPTAEELRPLGDALAARRRELRRLVHNLAVLSQAAGSKDRELATVVASGNATFQALASQEAALRASIRRLPGTLGATRTTLRHTVTFANQLGPTTQALLPTVRRLPRALRAMRPLLDVAEPLLRTKLRPFTREAQPLARDLGPATRDLTAVTPSLTNAFRVLVYVANELTYNPPGDNEGFQFWTAWFMHNAASFLSTEDAHGALWRGLLVTDCGALDRNKPAGVLLQTILGSVPGC